MKFYLRDMFNTKYFYTTFKQDLELCFKFVVEVMNDSSAQCTTANPKVVEVLDAVRSAAQVEFDIADCVITPDCYMVLKLYADKGIKFVDSKNNVRDAIFEENRRRLEYQNLDAVELPCLTDIENAAQFIDDLDPNVTYKLPLSKSDNIYIQLVYMINMLRPNIKIILGPYEKAFFNYVGSRLSPSDLKPYNRFYYVSNEGVQIVDFSKPVIIQRFGEVTKETILTTGYLIPDVLGKEVLADDLCFIRIFEECFDVVQAYAAKHVRHIDDVLQKRSNAV